MRYSELKSIIIYINPNKINKPGMFLLRNTVRRSFKTKLFLMFFHPFILKRHYLIIAIDLMFI